MSLPIRSTVQNLKPYPVGKPLASLQADVGIEELAFLGANENPLGPSPLAIEAIRDAAGSVHRYPMGSGMQLRAALAARFGIAVEQVFVGNGSDECIRLIGWAMLDGPEDEVLVGDPSFPCYDDAAKLAGASLRKFALKDYRIDLASMARATSERTRIVYIANPNNPTGTIVSDAELRRFAADLPKTALLVLDEAYYEYAAGSPGYTDGLEMAEPNGNVAVLRTFSKAYGLAGLRIGYGVGPLDLAHAVDCVRQPFNVSSISQVAALAAMDDGPHLERTFAFNRRGIERMTRMFARFGAYCPDSRANFVLASFDFPAEPLAASLLKRGVLVRSGTLFGLPNALRVSLGTDVEMDRFEAALESAMEERKTA